jgi:N-sulfoglucosamine sulfohydrolase
MKELLKMRDAGELDKNQSLWFRQTKEDEELFDLENDPHELNNIANDPSYGEVLFTLRNECSRWMKAIDDKGYVNEVDLISQFYPEGKAQSTAGPEIKINNGKIHVSCKTPGAQIGYRYASEKAPYLGWKKYYDHIDEKINDTIEIITHRLGFKYGITNVYNGVKSETTYPANSHDKKRNSMSK